MAFVTIIFMGFLFSMSGVLFPTKVCAVFMKLDESMIAIAKKGVRLLSLAFLGHGVRPLSQAPPLSKTMKGAFDNGIYIFG